MNFATFPILLSALSLALLSQGHYSTPRYSPYQPPSKCSTTVSTFIRGSPLGNWANGIIFDNQDRLHIASVIGREIIIIDRESGKVIDRLTKEDGVESPDDLIFGPDGSLYWTVLLTGEIGKRSPDGKTSVIAKLPPGVNPITISDDGRLFVGLCFLGEGLYELDPMGVKEPRLVIPKFPSNSKEGICSLNGMDFGKDGLLYGPRFFEKDIVKIDVDSGEFSVVASGFQTPTAVKFNSKGELFVVDLSSQLLTKVDVENGSKKVVAKLSQNLDNLAFDSNNRLFVSVSSDTSILEVNPDIESVRTVSRGGLSFPGGVAVVPRKGDDSLWVADFGAIYEFSARTGAVLTERPTSLFAEPLVGPNTIARDGNNFLLTNFFQNVIQIWDPRADKVLADYRNFAVPLNAIRFRGDFVVAQLVAKNVVRANERNVTKREVLVSDVAVPTGLAATNENVWVADWVGGKILQIIGEGKKLAKPVVVASGLNQPEGLAVARDGDLLVVEAGARRLIRIGLKSRRKCVLASNLDIGLAGPNVTAFPFSPSYALSGVDQAPNGDIFVAADKGRLIYKITQTKTRPKGYYRRFWRRLFRRNHKKVEPKY